MSRRPEEGCSTALGLSGLGARGRKRDAVESPVRLVVAVQQASKLW